MEEGATIEKDTNKGDGDSEATIFVAESDTVVPLATVREASCCSCRRLTIASLLVSASEGRCCGDRCS